MNQKRVVLVTGASSGIGRSCAEYLAERGYAVYGASRRVMQDARFEALSMDVRDEASVRDGVRAVLAREDRLDILVNNAGIAVAGAVEDTSVEEAREQFDANFFGVLRVCRAVLPAMRERKSGYIVNIGSIGGLLAIPFQGFYSASKFALEGLSESLRMEVRPFGIRVALIEPGDHRTGLTASRRVTEASKQDTPYRKRFEAALKKMGDDEQSGPDPERIARLLDRIVRQSNPRLRYTVGPTSQRAAAWLKRMLPYAVLEGLVASHYSD